MILGALSPAGPASTCLPSVGNWRSSDFLDCWRAGGVVIPTLIALIRTPTLPSLEDLSGAQLKVPMRVYTADGELIAEFGEEKRIPVRIEEVPDMLIKAVRAAEDRSFFYHHGVDFVGSLRP